MERSKLAVILRDLREFMGEHPLIVAGSQSAHGQIAWVPSTVVTSVEVDIFVLPGRGLHDPPEMKLNRRKKRQQRLKRVLQEKCQRPCPGGTSDSSPAFNAGLKGRGCKSRRDG